MLGLFCFSREPHKCPCGDFIFVSQVASRDQRRVKGRWRMMRAWGGECGEWRGCDVDGFIYVPFSRCCCILVLLGSFWESCNAEECDAVMPLEIARPYCVENIPLWVWRNWDMREQIWIFIFFFPSGASKLDVRILMLELIGSVCIKSTPGW